jgi:hypothetical protein
MEQLDAASKTGGQRPSAADFVSGNQLYREVRFTRSKGEYSIKCFMKSVLGLQLVAMGLAVVPAGQAEAKKSVPFKGFIQADEESSPLFPPDVPFPTLFVDASGSGVATQLGRFTVTYQFEVNLDTFFGVGSAEYVAANGDRVFTEGQGQGTVPTEDGTSVIVETNIITGGTGRFEGATGQFTLVRGF